MTIQQLPNNTEFVISEKIIGELRLTFYLKLNDIDGTAILASTYGCVQHLGSMSNIGLETGQSATIPRYNNLDKNSYHTKPAKMSGIYQESVSGINAEKMRKLYKDGMLGIKQLD